MLLLGCTAGQAQESDQRPSLNWMTGCWEARDSLLVIQEYWLSPVNDELLGLSRTIRRDSVIAYEFLRIYPTADGLVLAASPSGQAPAEFRLDHQGADVIEFLNAGHDFPQRVRYRSAGTDSLIGEIVGVRGGIERRIRFPYGRITCANG